MRYFPLSDLERLASLQASLEQNELIFDPVECALWAADIFHEGVAPLAIIRPRAKSSISSAMAAANTLGFAVVPRGGGLSYSAGTVPGIAPWLGLDTRSLEGIIEINPADMYVTVGAGCTWETLFEALRPLGLRTPFWGPSSGRFSTICATLSQNAVLYGSGRYGAAAGSVLGFELVTAEGRTFRTGSAAGSPLSTPFFRHYGPDLTGLFIGDNGAFAIKVTATLQLIHAPEFNAFTAFEFTGRQACASAMDEIGRRQLASECFAFDAAILARGLPVDDVSMAGPMIIAAAGRRYPASLGFRLDAAVEGRTAGDAASALAEIDAICRAAGGVAKHDSFLKAMRQEPFGSPNLILGSVGERWVPLHGIVPHSQHVGALDAIDDYMNARAAIIAEHEIEWGYSTLLVGPSAVLIEPALYWKDSRHALIESYFDRSVLASVLSYPENRSARAAIMLLRTGLIETFQRIGAVHLQIGRLYPLRPAQGEDANPLFDAIKKSLDPGNHLNPGIFNRPG
jgi:FAD/FMN-containing dehydrogenase